MEKIESQTDHAYSVCGEKNILVTEIWASLETRFWNLNWNISSFLYAVSMEILLACMQSSRKEEIETATDVI